MTERPEREQSCLPRIKITQPICTSSVCSGDNMTTDSVVTRRYVAGLDTDCQHGHMVDNNTINWFFLRIQFFKTKHFNVKTKLQLLYTGFVCYRVKLAIA